MRVSKLVIAAASATLIASALAGCNDATTDLEPNELRTERHVETPETAIQYPKGIVAGDLELTIEDAPEIGEGSLLVLKNTTTQDQTLYFNSGKQFDYKIYDANNKVVYTWSELKNFTQATEEKVLKPGEELVMNLGLDEAFSSLPTGDYTIEAFSTAEELRDTKVTLSDYHWINEEDIIDATSKEQVLEETVKFTGWADPHTVEVVNEKGESFALQVAESAKPELGSVSEGEKILIHYVDNGTTKELRVVTTYQD